MSPNDKEFGEGGFSPCNGLANSPRPLPIARNESDTTSSGAPSWDEIECLGGTYAPQDAPSPTSSGQGIGHSPKLVSRRLQELRTHPSWQEQGLLPTSSQLARLIAMGEDAKLHPIIITGDGVIIDGYARVELARREGRESLLCLEHPWSDEQALRNLILFHRPLKGLNDFDRALLALNLAVSLRPSARANQHLGGQKKGSTTLAEAQTVNVLSIASACAGISTGTLKKVKHIANTDDAEITQAVRAEEVSIHKGFLLCRLPSQQRREQLDSFRSRRGSNLTSCRLIRKHIANKRPSKLIAPTLIEVLSPFIPNALSVLGSIAVAEVDAPGTVAYFTKNALHTLATAERQHEKTRLDEEVPRTHGGILEST